MNISKMHDLQIYKCVTCHATGTLAQAPEADDCCESCLICDDCGSKYPIAHGVLDTLIDPAPHAIKELQGMTIEAGLPPGEWQSFRVRKLNSIATFADRLQVSKNDTNQYYQQTQCNFEQALQMLGNVHLSRCLEIGSETDYFFLQRFRDLGVKCHAVNLFFQYQEPNPFLEWPEKALADMNLLPFDAGVFDLVLLSATLHHSPNLDQTMREVSRVLRPGGTALVLSEQIGGLLKRVNRTDIRNSLINETWYPFPKYHLAFIRNGFRPTYLFSRYFEEKLSSSEINPKRRFARVGSTVAALWKIPGFASIARRALLYPAHILFGFPLNAILRKTTRSLPDR